MLSDLDIALLLQQQYDNTPDVFDLTIDVSGVYCSVKHYPDLAVVCFRGSATPLDFWRDFQGLMINDAELGGVEQGFITGLRDIEAHLETVIPTGKPAIIAGHSLGAARAVLFAGLWIEYNQPVHSIVTFGTPRPGSKSLQRILSGISIHSYCNGEDPVCKVPFDIPLLEPYCEPAPFIMLNEPPVSNDPWGPEIGWHHLSPNYINGIRKLA